jgi:hypothetical protein
LLQGLLFIAIYLVNREQWRAYLRWDDQQVAIRKPFKKEVIIDRDELVESFYDHPHLLLKDRSGQQKTFNLDNLQLDYRDVQRLKKLALVKTGG